MKTNYLLLLVVIGLIIFCSCRHNCEHKQSTKKIEVIGSAEMEVVPDQIYMIFTLKEYLDANRKKVNLETIKPEFLKLCKTAGIPDSSISITSYTGNERWDYYWYKRRKKEPEFMSSISYAILVSSPDKLDPIVSGLNEDAIENFYISKTWHSKMESLRQDVKTNALLASRSKAERFAKSIGEEIGETLLIQELEAGYSAYPPPVVANVSYEANQSMRMEGAAVGASPDFQKLKLRYDMRVEYKLK